MYNKIKTTYFVLNWTNLQWLFGPKLAIFVQIAKFKVYFL